MCLKVNGPWKRPSKLLKLIGSFKGLIIASCEWIRWLEIAWFCNWPLKKFAFEKAFKALKVPLYFVISHMIRKNCLNFICEILYMWEYFRVLITFLPFLPSNIEQHNSVWSWNWCAWEKFQSLKSSSRVLDSFCQKMFETCLHPPNLAINCFEKCPC